MFSKSAHEISRIEKLRAFNLENVKNEKKINQHKIVYTFGDNSTLWIFPTSSKAIAFNKYNMQVAERKLSINK